MSPGTTLERMLGVGALASLVAGLVAGIGARIIMRIVALTAHMPPGFTIEGTLHIMLLGTFIGFAVGFTIIFFTAVAFSFARVRKYLPGSVWRGLICGLLLLMVAFPIFVNFDAADLALGIPLLNKSMFGALFIMYGLTLGVAEKAFDHYLPGRSRSTKDRRTDPYPR